jgi:hypothetical protein
MRNKIYTLVGLVLATLMMTSCLKDDDNDDNGSSFRDTAITGFTLGQLKVKRDTLTKSGKNSTFYAKYEAKNLRFYIDQAQGLVYNVDSLPYGTDVAHVLATITTKNSGTVTILSQQGDKQTYFSPNDSIDFTSPRSFRVYSNARDTYRDYKISVNVHKQKGNVFSWASMQGNSNFGAFTAMKAVSTKDKIFVFGTDGTQTKGYVTAQNDGNHWALLSQSFSAQAYQSVLVKENKLFILDSGRILSSTDGNAWTQVGTNTNLKQLVAASSSELFALTTAGSLVRSQDNGATWNVETLDDNASLLPVSNINYALLINNGADDMSRVLLVGTTASGNKTVTWTRLSYKNRPMADDTWNYVENAATKFLLPAYRHLTVVNYDGAALAMGVDSSGKFGSMLLSRDAGIVWNSDKDFSYPLNVQPANTFTATVDADAYIWMISGSKVWRGRLNRVGWKLNQERAAE